MQFLPSFLHFLERSTRKRTNTHLVNGNDGVDTVLPPSTKRCLENRGVPHGSSTGRMPVASVVRAHRYVTHRIIVEVFEKTPSSWCAYRYVEVTS
jgi:hypothetical protein